MVGVSEMTPDIQTAVIWFLMQPTVVLLSVGATTAITIVIAALFLLRKWGGY